MQIKLNLILSLIVEAVKAETYIKGAIDRAAGGDQQASNGVAYHETAGDESVHERKIVRGIYTSADKLRSYVQDYLDNTNGSSVGDNNTLTVNESTDKIEITLTVGDRFNKANTDALARLFSKYIEDNTLVLWWGAINQQQMQFYQSLLSEDISAINRLFIKKAPSAPSAIYTSTLSVTGTSISLEVDEKSTVTYTISDGVIDDIDAASSDNWVADVHRSDDGFVVHGRNEGECTIRLFSRHNDTLSKTLSVVVG